MRLTGHIDVLSIVGDEVRIADFKTGWVDANHDEQLRGYCWLALQNYPDAKTAYAVVIRVRDQLVDTVRYLRHELDVWWGRRRELLSADPAYYSPGPHCRHCHRAHECPGRTAIVQESLLRVLGDDSEIDTVPSRILDMMDRIALVQDECERFRDWVRVQVAAAGGTLSDGEREIILKQTQQKQLIPRFCLSVLRTAISGDALFDCVTVSKTKVEDALRATAPRGQKGTVVKEVFARLEQAGAIKNKVIERMEVRRCPQAIGVIHESAE
jgi:hypothetical protein